MIETKKTAPVTVDVQVELFGQARILSGKRRVGLTVPGRAQPADLAFALSETCPELVGKVLREDRTGLQESYTFNLNGTAFVGNGPLDMKSGDHLLLFSSMAGG